MERKFTTFLILVDFYSLSFLYLIFRNKIILIRILTSSYKLHETKKQKQSVIHRSTICPHAIPITQEKKTWRLQNVSGYSRHTTNNHLPRILPSQQSDLPQYNLGNTTRIPSWNELDDSLSRDPCDRDQSTEPKTNEISWKRWTRDT